MENDTERNNMLATIEQAVFVERRTNPDCPIANELIQEALKRNDIEFAYKIALDCLKPEKGFIAKVKMLFKPS